MTPPAPKLPPAPLVPRPATLPAPPLIMLALPLAPPLPAKPLVTGESPLAPDEPGISTLSELAPQPTTKIDTHTQDRTEPRIDSRMGDLRKRRVHRRRHSTLAEGASP